MLTRTTVAINGMKSEFADIKPGKRVYPLPAAASGAVSVCTMAMAVLSLSRCPYR